MLGFDEQAFGEQFAQGAHAEPPRDEHPLPKHEPVLERADDELRRAVDDGQGADRLWRVDGQLEGDGASQRQSDHVGRPGFQGFQQGGGIRCKHRDAIGLARFIGLAVTAEVEGDDSIRLGELRQLIFPIARAGAQAVDQQHGFAAAMDFIVEVDAVRADLGHGGMPGRDSVPLLLFAARFPLAAGTGADGENNGHAGRGVAGAVAVR